MLIGLELAKLQAKEAPAPRHLVPVGSSAGVSVRRTLTMIDAAALALAVGVAMLLTGPRSVPLGLAETALLVGYGMAVMHVLKLDRARISAVRAAEMQRLFLTSVAVGLGAAAFAGPDRVRPGAAVVSLVFLVLALERTGVSAWFRLARISGRMSRPVLVIGTTAEAKRIVELIVHHPELGYAACGVVGDRSTHETSILGVPWLGGPDAALEAVDTTGVTGAILASSGMASADLNRIIRTLQDRGVHLQLWSGMLGIAHQRVRVQPFAHEAMLYLEPRTMPALQASLKRATDVVLATIALVVSAPLFALAAIAIKWNDGGPVLFRQTRVGRDGEPFTVFKLRTMVVDAEARLAALQAMNQRTGPLFKADHDPRTTRVGRFLRDSSIDELPQLVNVLLGHMSLVGPRPALPAEVADFDDELHARHGVRPGVTGLWQLEARDNPSFFAYRHLDLFYVENVTFSLDLLILCSTVWSVVGRAVRTVVRSRTGSPAANLSPLAAEARVTALRIS